MHSTDKGECDLATPRNSGVEKQLPVDFDFP